MAVRACSEEEKLESIGDRQVREWLSTTFTRTDSLYETHHVPMTPIVKFKAAANTIIITQYFGRYEHNVCTCSRYAAFVCWYAHYIMFGYALEHSSLCRLEHDFSR